MKYKILNVNYTRPHPQSVLNSKNSSIGSYLVAIKIIENFKDRNAVNSWS